MKKRGTGTAQKGRWQTEALTIGLLIAFGFWINSGMEIRGLSAADLNQWIRFREGPMAAWLFSAEDGQVSVVFKLIYAIVTTVIGSRLRWYVPFLILLNSAVAYTVVRFAEKLTGNRPAAVFFGLLYLLSRMSYYQIGQMAGMQESLAHWAAVGVLFCLFQYLNGGEERDGYFWGACGLFLLLYFIQGRFLAMGLLLVLAPALNMERKLRDWLPGAVCVLAVFVFHMIISGGAALLRGGPALTQALGTAASCAFCLLGGEFTAGGPESLLYAEASRWFQLVAAVSDLIFLALFVWFLVRMITDRGRRAARLKNLLLFAGFGVCAAAGVCMAPRPALYQVYVLMTGVWLLMAYMLGEAARPPEKKLRQKEDRVKTGLYPEIGRHLTGILLIVVYFCLMLRVETYYRDCYPKLPFWKEQTQANSLARQTWEQYGDSVFARKIFILENEFGISDEYRTNFFRPFSGDRENTEIRIAGSIHDIGQVTDNMVVLSENVPAFGYADVTEMIRGLKCEVIYGYYSDSWMEEEAQLRVLTGRNGIIRLKLLYPDVMLGDEVCRIYLNGEPAKNVRIDHNMIDVEIGAEPCQFAELTFENNFYAESMTEQRGDRRLSLMVQITTD